jgi:effector-binding domain-containing protein
MTYECTRVELASQPTLVVRRRTAIEALPRELGRAWGEVMAVAQRSGVEPVGAPFAAFHNRDMQDLDVEMGFVFEHAVEGAGEVVPGDIPAGTAVQCAHVGPFDRLHDAYEALWAWLADHGLEHVGPAYEHYLDDPAEVPIERVRTLIVVRVR